MAGWGGGGGGGAGNGGHNLYGDNIICTGRFHGPFAQPSVQG